MSDPEASDSQASDSQASDPKIEGALSEREERFNISLRKFLKQVGITSQREIERAVREGDIEGDAITVRMRLTGEGGLDHTIEGRIVLP